MLNSENTCNVSVHRDWSANIRACMAFVLCIELKILKERRRELTVMDHVSQLSADEEAQVEELEYRVASDQVCYRDRKEGDLISNT